VLPRGGFATDRHHRQFVMETTLIAPSSAAFWDCSLRGSPISRVIASFAGWSTNRHRRPCAPGFSVSVLIGLVFGVYPAVEKHHGSIRSTAATTSERRSVNRIGLAAQNQK